MDETVVVGEHTIGARKRPKEAENRREERKKARYRDKDPTLQEFEPPCTHETGAYRCCAIPIRDLMKCKKQVFKNVTKISQDTHLSYMLKVRQAKIRKPLGNLRKYNKESKKKSIKYFIKLADGSKVRVCAKFFQKLFQISQTRINTIAKAIINGEVIGERRGGNHKSHLFRDKIEAVTEYLSKLHGNESHYNRNKSKRIYLSSTLSINKLFKMYNNECPEHLKVKKTFFCKIFSTKFNIGFGRPAVDVCSYCVSTKFAIKSEKDVHKKNILMHSLGAHKLRAKTFFKLLKANPPESITICFDLQQIHPLPKLNIGEAYYASQINFYAFGIVVVETKETHFYTWTELQADKGSVEITSALLDFLNNYHFDEVVNTIRLFCDSCGGQNKNMHMVHGLSWWLHNKAPMHIKEITLFYPVRGHSYMPPDRAFGVVEKKLKTLEEILFIEKYTEIYEETGKVHELNKDWKLMDIKSLSITMKKTDGIMDAKRIYLKKKLLRNKTTGITTPRIDMRMENFYIANSGRNYEPIMKKGRKMENTPAPQPLAKEKGLNDKKKKDVSMLLKKRFGEEWKTYNDLVYYKLAIDDERVDLQVQAEEDEDCCCLEIDNEMDKF